MADINAEASDFDPKKNPADLKIILLGDSLVGKSKLVERFLMDDYVPQTLSTYALTVFRHNAKVSGKEVKVDFWDTAGQERFNTMHQSYYYRANACILAFDVSRKNTYTNLKVWYEELQKYRKGIPVLVVANKIDMNRDVTNKTFAFASKLNLPFFFVSAAEGDNVVKVFTEAIQQGLDAKETGGNFDDDVMEALDYLDKRAAEDAAEDAAPDQKD